MIKDKAKNEVPIWVWLVSCLAILAVCGVVVVAGLVVAFVTFSVTTATVVSTPAVSIVTIEVATSALPSAITPAPASPQPSPTDAPPQTATPAGTGNNSTPAVADPHAAVRARIEANVVDIRGLESIEPVEPLFLTTDELRAQLEADLAEDYSPEQARLDVLVLSAFDFLEPDFDLYNFTIDLLTEQVAGYYDTETKEFVLVGDDAQFSALEQWTHAHEYTHALQDQHFDLGLLNDDSLDSEAAFALRALAEGDATLVQSIYLTGGYFSQAQLFEILTSAGEIDTTIFDSAPPILARELEFPYKEGLIFAQALYDRDGFAAIDEAWQNLPQSTEQIIHPDRYLAGDSPQIVSLPPLTDTLGLGWQLLQEDILGEFYLREYLSQQLSSVEVTAAATGWGGDRFAVYHHEEDGRLVMVLRLVWDTPADGDEFAATYAQYPARLLGGPAEDQADGGRCWRGSDDLICLYHADGETVIIRAPDLTVLAAVVDALAQ
jgi:hypothetical protein